MSNTRRARRTARRPANTAADPVIRASAPDQAALGAALAAATAAAKVARVSPFGEPSRLAWGNVAAALRLAAGHADRVAEITGSAATGNPPPEPGGDTAGSPAGDSHTDTTLTA